MPVLDDTRPDPWQSERVHANDADDANLAAVVGRRGGPTESIVPRQPVPANAVQQPESFAALARRDPLAAVGVYRAKLTDHNISESDLAETAETVRVALADSGQQLLARYIEGEQTAMSKADFTRGKELFEAEVHLPHATAFDESRLFFFKGRELIFDEEYEEALRCLERSVELDPDRAYSYNAIGIAYLQQGAKHLSEAIAAFKDASRLAPNWAYPRHNLALAYSEQGRYDDAREQYQLALHDQPVYSYIPYNLGVLYQRTHRLEDAEKLYLQAKTAAELNRHYGIVPVASPWTERADILNALGTVAAARHKNEIAEAYYSAALRDAPDLDAARYNLGLIVKGRGPSWCAEHLLFESANSQDSAIALASRLALGDYFRAKDPQRATLEYLEALNVDPKNIQARQQLTRLFIDAKLWQDAYRQVTVLRLLLPKSGEAAEQLANIALHLGRKREGLAALDEASHLYPAKSDQRRMKKELDKVGRQDPDPRS